MKFVCGQSGPEDLVAVPNSRWLIASAYGGDGGLYLIDTRAASSTKIYPSAASAVRLDKKTYDTCPGPPQTAPRIQTHGLFLQEGGGGRHTLYVVVHGSRESVEVFELDARRHRLARVERLRDYPPPHWFLNSVLPGPAAFVATTSPRAPAVPRRGASRCLDNGRTRDCGRHTAAVAKVPAANRRGQRARDVQDVKFLVRVGNRSFIALSRGQTPVVRDTLNLGSRGHRTLGARRHAGSWLQASVCAVFGPVCAPSAGCHLAIGKWMPVQVDVYDPW